MDCIDEIVMKILPLGFSEDALRVILNDYEIKKKETAITVGTENQTREILKMFLIGKKVEGCTENTVKYYKYVLEHFFLRLSRGVREINAEQIRYYLALRSMEDGVSKTTQDNELRVLRSFFEWCTAEEYISKNPTAKIKAIKKEKTIKKPFSEIELEKIRQAAERPRDKAIIEVLYSTGCRVSELCGMNRQDITGDEITVLGKGEKERIVYLNAKATIALNNYLTGRRDTNTALFVSQFVPYKRLQKGRVEQVIREIGRRAGVRDCHPHRFRRTAATLALNRGMPIEQVQKMLGHENIETTTIYARSDRDNVKSSHRKYIT